MKFKKLLDYLKNLLQEKKASFFSPFNKNRIRLESFFVFIKNSFFHIFNFFIDTFLPTSTGQNLKEYIKYCSYYNKRTIFKPSTKLEILFSTPTIIFMIVNIFFIVYQIECSLFQTVPDEEIKKFFEWFQNSKIYKIFYSSTLFVYFVLRSKRYLKEMKNMYNTFSLELKEQPRGVSKIQLRSMFTVLTKAGIKSSITVCVACATGVLTVDNTIGIASGVYPSEEARCYAFGIQSKEQVANHFRYSAQYEHIRQAHGLTKIQSDILSDKFVKGIITPSDSNYKLAKTIHEKIQYSETGK